MFDFNELMYIKYKLMANRLTSAESYKVISRKEKELLVRCLSKLSNDDTDGDFDNILIKLLETMFNNHKEAYDFLNELKLDISDEKVKTKIESLQQKLEDDKNKEKPTVALNINNNMPVFDSVEQEIVRRKYNYYAKFALNKTLNALPSLVETKKVAGKFEGLARKELVEYFNADEFYALNSNQQKQLYQAVVNEYCMAAGVPACEVKYEDLPLSEKAICYGEYDPNNRNIHLNKNVIELLQDAQKNQYLPYKILATLIHEAKHACQFANIGKDELSTKDQYIKNSLITNQSGLTYAQYLAEPDELDARNAAQQYLREVCEATNNANLAAFYNMQAEQERHNFKEQISKDCEVYFPDIYNSKTIETKADLIGDLIKYQCQIKNSLYKMYQ